MFEVKLVAINPIPAQLDIPMTYYKTKISRRILNTICDSPIKAIYVTLPSIIALFINIDPRHPNSPLSNKIMASPKERNLISSNGE